MEENVKISPTIEWMRENYDKLNQKYFDGELGDCNFELFTSKRTLGWFKMDVKDIGYMNDDRRLFVKTLYGRKLVNRDNFVELCKPTIALNESYIYSEKSLLSTLLHEMCHYYTHKDGIYPSQSHGAEFYDIGRKVSAKSNELFPVERLASAEEMSELLYSEGAIAKKTKNGTYVIIVEFAKPYQYSKDKTYKYGYAKIQSKQGLGRWINYILLNKQMYKAVNLYNAENAQAWVDMDNYKIGYFTLTNNANRIQEKLQLVLERDMMIEDSEFEKQAIDLEKKAYETIVSEGNNFAYLIVKALYGKLEYSDYDEDDYDGFKVKPFTKSIKGVKVSFLNGSEWYSCLSSNVLKLYLNCEMWKTQDFLNEVSYYYENEEYLERSINFIEDLISRALAPQRQRYAKKATEPNTNQEQTTSANATSQDSTNNPNIIPIFRLKLGNSRAGTVVSNNNTFEVRNVTKEELKEKIKERFPKMSDEAIEKVMNNPANYPQEESKMLHSIVESVLCDFIRHNVQFV